jgi:hypothetical protein
VPAGKREVSVLVGDRAANFSAVLHLGVDFPALPFGQFDRIRFFGVGLAAVPLLDVVQRGVAFDVKTDPVGGGPEPADRVLAFGVGTPVAFIADQHGEPFSADGDPGDRCAQVIGDFCRGFRRWPPLPTLLS